MKNLTITIIFMLTLCSTNGMAYSNNNTKIIDSIETQFENTEPLILKIKICFKTKNGRKCIYIDIEIKDQILGGLLTDDGTLAAISKYNSRKNVLILYGFPKELNDSFVNFENQEYSGYSHKKRKAYIIPGKYKINNGKLNIPLEFLKSE